MSNIESVIFPDKVRRALAEYRDDDCQGASGSVEFLGHGQCVVHIWTDDDHYRSSELDVDHFLHAPMAAWQVALEWLGVEL